MLHPMIPQPVDGLGQGGDAAGKRGETDGHFGWTSLRVILEPVIYTMGNLPETIQGAAD